MEHESVDRVVSHYRILRKLGAGGMGEVFLADDTDLERRVAIKFLAADRASNPDDRSRFIAEARAAAALDHRHICPVYEVNATADPPFIVMQFLDGETLASRLRAGPLTPEAAVRLGLEIAGALAEAHAHGIVHRDVKPQNIIISPGGESHLLDFGIAKRPALDIGGLTARATMVATVTEFAGTPAYMAPEQIQHRAVDGRTDLFALGLVLYECFTGRPAFTGSSLLDLITSILHSEPPSPSALQPRLTPAHDDVVAQLMAKNPDDRFQSALAAATALRELGAGRTTRTDPLPAPRRAPRRLAIAALLVAVVGVAAYRMFRSPPGPSRIAPQAERWYRDGVSALQEGAYAQAERILGRTVEMDDQYALAWARLGEAQLELDRESQAQNSLLRASLLVRDRSRLPAEDRLSLEATTAMAGREYDVAVKAYEQLATRSPTSAQVLVDLGRAHEARGDVDKAIQYYQRATELDPDNPAPQLRLGVLYGRRADASRAQAAFDRAEALYSTTGRVEGVAAVLFQRGVLFDRLNHPAEARAVLTKALAQAETVGSDYLRAAVLFKISSLDAAEGHLIAAQAKAVKALDIGKGFASLSAFGLVDLGNVFVYTGEHDRATQYFRQALEASLGARARRAEARARLALGSLQIDGGQVSEGVANARAANEYYKKAGFKSLETTSLTVLASGQERSGDLAGAQASYEALLGQSTGNASQVAEQRHQLAHVLLLRERYAAALVENDRAQAIYQTMDAPYDRAHALLQRVEILGQLGRADEAGLELERLYSPESGTGQPTAELDALRAQYRADLALIGGDFARAERLARLAALALGRDTAETIAADLRAIRALAMVRAGRLHDGLPVVEQALAGDVVRRDPVRKARLELIAARALAAAGRHSEAFARAQPLLREFSLRGQKESEWLAATILGRVAASLGRPDAEQYRQAADHALSEFDAQLSSEARATWRRRRDVHPVAF